MTFPKSLLRLWLLYAAPRYFHAMFSWCDNDFALCHLFAPSCCKEVYCKFDSVFFFTKSSYQKPSLLIILDLPFPCASSFLPSAMSVEIICIRSFCQSHWHNSTQHRWSPKNLTQLNSKHPTIKFELELPDNSGVLPILATQIQIDTEGHITCKLFTKKASKHLFLHY